MPRKITLSDYENKRKEESKKNHNLYFSDDFGRNYANQINFIGDLTDEAVLTIEGDVANLVYDPDTNTTTTEAETPANSSFVLADKENGTILTRGIVGGSGGGGGGIPDTNKTTPQARVKGAWVDVPSSGGNDVKAVSTTYGSAKLETDITLQDNTVIKSTPQFLTANELIYSATDNKTIKEVVDAISGGGADYNYVSTDPDFETAKINDVLTVGYDTITPSTPLPKVNDIIVDSTLSIYSKVISAGTNNCDVQVYAIKPAGAGNVFGAQINPVITPNGKVSGDAFFHGKVNVPAYYTIDNDLNVLYKTLGDPAGNGQTYTVRVGKQPKDNKLYGVFADASAFEVNDKVKTEDITKFDFVVPFQVKSDLLDVLDEHKNSFIDGDVAVITDFSTQGRIIPNPEYIGGSYPTLDDFVINAGEDVLTHMKTTEWGIADSKTFKLYGYQESNYSTFASTNSRIHSIELKLPDTPPTGSVDTTYTFRTSKYNADGTMTVEPDNTTNNVAFRFQRTSSGYTLTLTTAGESKQVIVNSVGIDAQEFTIGSKLFRWAKVSDTEFELFINYLWLTPRNGNLLTPNDGSEIISWLGGVNHANGPLYYDGGFPDDDDHKFEITVPAGSGLLNQKIYDELKQGSAPALQLTDIFVRTFTVSQHQASDTSVNSFTVSWYTTSISQKAQDLSQLASLCPPDAIITGTSRLPSDGSIRQIFGHGVYNGNFRLNVINTDGTTQWVDCNAGADIQEQPNRSVGKFATGYNS